MANEIDDNAQLAELPLPPELQDHITSYITRPSDLQSLCLTCKQLRYIATPRLYNTVILDLHNDYLLQDEGENLQDHGHVGHKYLRNLVFYTTSDFYLSGDRIDQEETMKCQQAVKLVLHALPWHQIETLVLPNRMIIDGPTFHMINTTQHALTSLPAKDITALSIPEDIAEGDCDLYADIIKLNSTRLRHLALKEAPQIRDSYPENTKGLYTMLLGLHAEQKSPVLCLETLEMVSHHFKDVSFLKTAIRLENLRILKISLSLGTDKLFDELATQFQHCKPKLQGIELVSRSGSPSEQDLRALERLLKSFSGLEFLKVVSDYGQDKLDLDSLANHRTTLTDLYLAQSGHNYESIGRLSAYSQGTLSGFCLRHRKLRQLALPFPEINQDLIFVGCADFDRYITYADAMKSLPELQVLRILSIPYGRTPMFNQDPEAPAEPTREIDVIATSIIGRIVRGNQTSKLKLLCIGEAELSDEMLSGGPTKPYERKVPCVCYYRGRQTDWIGREQDIAVVRQTPHLIKYDLPFWDAVTDFWSEARSYDHGLGLGDYDRPRFM